MKLANLLLLSAAWLVFSGCSLVRTLNMKEHNFGRQAKHIVWFQIAGLSEEHMALLKYSKKNEDSFTSLEKASCIGQVWNYNLYSLRPAAEDGFIAQMSGSGDVLNSCKKYEKRFVWESLYEMGFYAGILESIGENSGYLSSARYYCKKTLLPKLKRLAIWKMSKRGKKEIDSGIFHYQDSSSGKKGSGIYFDRSCNETGCYSSISNNAKALYDQFREGKSQYLFMVRDFSYLKALQSKHMSRIEEILYELDKTIKFFVDESERDQNLLVVVSSTRRINLDFPRSGKEWFEFDKENKYVSFKHSSLSSPIFSFGAGAENFCGFYKEYEVLPRVLEAASKGKVKFKFLNFF
jgi:hypothetical protein